MLYNSLPSILQNKAEKKKSKNNYNKKVQSSLDTQNDKKVPNEGLRKNIPSIRLQFLSIACMTQLDPFAQLGTSEKKGESERERQ